MLKHPDMMTIGTGMVDRDRFDSVMRSQNRLRFANVVFTLGTIGAVLLSAIAFF